MLRSSIAVTVVVASLATAHVEALAGKSKCMKAPPTTTDASVASHFLELAPCANGVRFAMRWDEAGRKLVFDRASLAASNGVGYIPRDVLVRDFGVGAPEGGLPRLIGKAEYCFDVGDVVNASDPTNQDSGTSCTVESNDGYKKPGFDGHLICHTRPRIQYVWCGSGRIALVNPLGAIVPPLTDRPDEFGFKIVSNGSRDASSNAREYDGQLHYAMKWDGTRKKLVFDGCPVSHSRGSSAPAVTVNGQRYRIEPPADNELASPGKDEYSFDAGTIRVFVAAPEPPKKDWLVHDGVGWQDIENWRVLSKPTPQFNMQASVLWNAHNAEGGSFSEIKRWR
jgi:hypothetical protein